MSLKRPMKAPTDPITNEELRSIKQWPIVGSPKLDGFRCVVDEYKAKTSSMKLIQNRFTQAYLGKPMFNGLDGELVVGEPNDPNVFHNTSGPLRRFEGKPDFKFYVFDCFEEGHLTYEGRWLRRKMKEASEIDERIIVLPQKFLYTPNDVIDYEAEMVAAGYEGAMIRSICTTYKEGRTTLREQSIFKRKPFITDEAVILYFEEAMENQNEIKTNAMGTSVRSSNQENLVPKNTLGAFVLKSQLWAEPFHCGTGTGLTAELRQKIWNNKEAYVGKIVTYKYQKYGSIDKPRIPVFKCFRPGWDLDEGRIV